MTNQHLAHIVYISNAARPFTQAELERLLQNAQHNNQREEITGVLLHHGTTFIQCIEGPRDKLDTLYARIAADKRHKNLIKVLDEPIDQRSFGDWKMGCTKLSESAYLKISTAEWRQTAADGAGDTGRSLGFKALLGFWTTCVADSHGQPRID